MFNLKDFLPLIVPLIWFSIFFFIMAKANRLNRELFKNLANYLPGKLNKSFFMPSFAGEYQGQKFTISLFQGSRNSPPFLEVLFMKNSPLRLRLYKENALSRFGERIGIVREVKINDESFDKEFVILANDHTKALFYLGNSSVKNTIRELFSSGFNVFVSDGKKIIIRKPNYHPDQDLSPMKVREMVQKLSSLTRGL